MHVARCHKFVAGGEYPKLTACYFMFGKDCKINNIRHKQALQYMFSLRVNLEGFNFTRLSNIVVSSNFIRTEKYIFVFYECTFELILNVNSVTVLQLQIKLKKYTSA